MPKTTKGRLERPKDARSEADERRRKAVLAATRKLPAGIQRYVREASKEMPSADVVLETGILLLMAEQGKLLEAQAADEKRYKENVKRAKVLRHEVKDLAPADTKRQAYEARAISLEKVRPNTIGSARAVSELSDRIRKLTDSLAMHRPAGFTRVTVEVRTGHEHQPWSGDPGDNLHTEYTEEDEEYLRQVGLEPNPDGGDG